jgi:uncharacterized protein (TIGR02996 family)
MTEAELLAGIATHPAELDRWLVLADWLEDHGDPRAELARLRFLLHAEPDHPERDRRQARQQALLESGFAPVVPKWTNSLGMEFALILPGTFWMGSPDSEQERSRSETKHRVTLTQPYYLGIYPVTVGEFRQFVTITNYQTYAERYGYGYGLFGEQFSYDPSITWRTPRFAQSARHPVVCVNWDDTQALVEWLNEVESGTGLVYSLPSEAQWEYACRAGTQTPFFWGDDIGKLRQYGWFRTNSNRKTHSVSTKKPNGWGLWHMLGHVEEWCADWHGDYPTGEGTDPLGPSEGFERIFRGGSWDSLPESCGSACRCFYDANSCYTYNGFRLAVSVRLSIG